jgi:hypothetical protein
MADRMCKCADMQMKFIKFTKKSRMYSIPEDFDLESEKTVYPILS